MSRSLGLGGQPSTISAEAKRTLTYLEYPRGPDQAQEPSRTTQLLGVWEVGVCVEREAQGEMREVEKSVSVIGGVAFRGELWKPAGPMGPSIIQHESARTNCCKALQEVHLRFYVQFLQQDGGVIDDRATRSCALHKGHLQLQQRSAAQTEKQA
jgi:hypothetical protein